MQFIYACKGNTVVIVSFAKVGVALATKCSVNITTHLPMKTKMHNTVFVNPAGDNQHVQIYIQN